MELIPVQQDPSAKEILYLLLLEREGKTDVNISHAQSPSYEDHCRFVDSHPYRDWSLIKVGGDIVGAVYLTPPPRPSVAGNELGIFIFEKHWDNGYATQALRMMMDRYGPQDYYAHINPGNAASLSLFGKLGFTVCQHTYRKRPE